MKMSILFLWLVAWPQKLRKDSTKIKPVFLFETIVIPTQTQHFHQIIKSFFEVVLPKHSLVQYLFLYQ